MSIGKIELRVYRGKSKITNPKCIYIERARSDVINVEQENKFKSPLCTAYIQQSIHFHNGYRVDVEAVLWNGSCSKYSS